MVKNKKRGFTLTELIIVIVIIGILAAVLIPSISGYVKKAKISKGVQEAKEMNTILAAEAIYQDKEYFDPNEIRDLLVEADFELKSQLEDYRFWYNASTNQMEYLSIEEVFGGISAAKKEFTQDCIEALSSSHPEYRYMDTYNDELTQVVSTVRNLIPNALNQNGISDSSSVLSDQSKKDAVLDTMDDLIGDAATSINNLKIKNVKKDLLSSIKTSVTNYVNTFDTANSVYVDNNVMYNRAYFAADVATLEELEKNNANINYMGDKLSLEVAHMVFSSDISTIPECKTLAGVEYDVVITTVVNVPNTVTTIQNNSFTNVSYAASIVVSNTTIIDNNALSDAAKTVLTETSSNTNFVTLYLGSDFEVSYENAEAKLNNGTIATYTKGSETNLKLQTLILDSNNKLIYDSESTGSVNANLISKYLIPSIKFNNNKIDFSKITKFVIRRSLLDNICTYTGILIDEDLNGYKIESFGYITDIDWSIEQNFIGKDEQGNRVIGAKTATIKVYLPSYVYNFTNFKGASMEVTLLPQYIKSREENTMTGSIDVYDGVALSDQKITFYIEDGVYNKNTGMYEYEKTIENLSNYTLTLAADQPPVECNQLYINQISIYTGKVSYDESNNPITDNLNYLFMRFYK